MDGTIIQEATQAALAGGFRLRDTFTAVREITRRVEVPVLVMTYWNPVLQYGVDRYADDLLAAGGAGLITPDITPDAAADWIAASERTGLDRVFLAAPTSTDERLDLIVEASTGFVYTVSTMGITGERARAGCRRPPARRPHALSRRGAAARVRRHRDLHTPTRSPACSSTPTARSSARRSCAPCATAGSTASPRPHGHCRGTAPRLLTSARRRHLDQQGHVRP